MISLLHDFLDVTWNRQFWFLWSLLGLGASIGLLHLVWVVLTLPSRLSRRRAFRDACDATCVEEVCQDAANTAEKIVARAVGMVPVGRTVRLYFGGSFDESIQVTGGREGAPGKLTYRFDDKPIQAIDLPGSVLSRLVPRVRRELARQCRQYRRIKELGESL